MQETTVTRIAHVSDVHMLASRPSRSRAGYSMGVRFVSIGRPLDAQARARKFQLSLAAAKRSHADHIVVSGDLTEIGSPAEFEALAETLHDARIDPERITLVPGNHAAYTSMEAWKWALAGPLAAYASSAATVPGKVVDRGSVAFLPLDVTRSQPLTRSAGELTASAAEAVERRANDAAFRQRPLVGVAHHPPFAHAVGAWQWIDGLAGGARLMSLLASFTNLYALHGHLHYVVDKIVQLGRAHAFGAPAIVDDKEDRPRVRLYDVRDGGLEAAGIVGA